jgi:flagellar motility protein MotE (MotC chaperone)
MRKMLVGGSVVLVLFGVSAAASWILQRGSESHGEGSEGETGTEMVGKLARSHGDLSLTQAPASGLRPALRASYNPEAEGAAQLAANLRNQLDAVKAREQHLTTRQKHLDLIFQDIRSEGAAVDELRKQVDAEMKVLQQKLEALEKKAADVDNRRQKASAEVKELKSTLSEVQNVEKDRVKQISSIYDTMEPESAAEILQTMVDTGKMDTAVKILSTMRERQAARVLAQLTDRTSVVQMLEKLKGLRRPAAPAE